MTDRPILFSGPMVRALLDGRKTQTRRVLNPQPPADMGLVGIYAPKLTAVFGYETPDTDYKVTLRYMPGDRLWVREAWRTHVGSDHVAPREISPELLIQYEASGPSFGDGLSGKVRPSMFMPRWASRLTLTVTDVRVQRLQEISEADAIAEGVPTDDDYAGSFAKEYCHHCGGSGVHGAFGAGYGMTEVDCAECETAKLRFRNLWDSINAGRGYGWDANPWVVVIGFTVEHGNIDRVQP